MNKQSTWFLVGSALVLAGFVALNKSGVKVVSLSSIVKEVSVDGRTYLVTRLGTGTYNVTNKANPAIAFTFNQDGPVARIGDTKQLEADLPRFPNNLFA